MKRPGKLITRSSLNMTFNRRTALIGGAQALIGVTLASRMAYVSVVENERYKMLSESNRVNLTLIPPRRGWIIDRNGKPLANNKADFRVDLIPQRVRDVDATIGQLRDILKMDPDKVEDLRAAMKDARGLQPVPVASGLSYEDFASLSVRLPDLPGVAPQRGFSRQYPTGAAVGHLLGYVGIVNAEEYEKNKNPLLITPGFKIGKDGLEQYFEPQLQGKPGARKVEVTARGKIVRELGVQEDVPGKPLQLTIDGRLQEYIARRLGRESGAAVVIDCQTGGILAFSSMPCFDPNSFSDGIGRLEYAMLSQDERVPLLNKATRGLYPPGSTLKPMAAIACLQNGVDPDETVNCPGAIDWETGSTTAWGGMGRSTWSARSRKAATPISMPRRTGWAMTRLPWSRASWAWARISISPEPISAMAPFRIANGSCASTSRRGPHRIRSTR